MRRLRHRRNLCTGQLHTNWLAKTVAQMVERKGGLPDQEADREWMTRYPELGPDFLLRWRDWPEVAFWETHPG
jgi:hypothetical protein